MKKLFVLSLLLTPLLFSSCEKSKLDKEMEELEQYLLENGITTEPTSSGIYFILIEEGNGPEADGGDQVKVQYTGTFLSGEEFDSGIFTFRLGIGMVIPGWDEGINYMRVGDKARLIIPSQMAYGPDGYMDIPGYATLVFDVELLDIL